MDLRGFRKIKKFSADAKVIFLMRDPVERLCSHIQHVRRHKKVDVAKVVHGLNDTNPFYINSNYGATLDKLETVFEDDQVLTLFYEDLFNEDTIRSLCGFLEIGYKKPNFSKRINVSRLPPIDDDLKSVIREKLEPIYADMSNRFGDKIPAKWRVYIIFVHDSIFAAFSW